MNKMNVEKQIRRIQKEESASIDSRVFISNLHMKRAQNDALTTQRINGLVTFCLLTLFSFLTVSQLAYEPGTFASTDLIPFEEMDAETETYVVVLFVPYRLSCSLLHPFDIVLCLCHCILVLYVFVC